MGNLYCVWVGHSRTRQSCHGSSIQKYINEPVQESLNICGVTNALIQCQTSSLNTYPSHCFYGDMWLGYLRVNVWDKEG